MPEVLLALRNRLRLIVLFATLLVALGLVNSQILIKERIVRDGTTMLLEIAPRDPRSLLQGDFMALRYRMTEEVAAAADAAGLSDGVAIVTLDDAGVASFEAIDSGQPLGPGRHLLRFRKRGDSVRLASDAYFFEEGTWEVYADAAYGEIRVAADGDAVLIGLRDRERRRLGGSIDR